MMEQLSLFDVANRTIYDDIQDLLDEVIASHNLPQKSIHLYSNISAKGKNAGKETSKSICIYEPEYPPRKDVVENPGKNFVIMNIKSAKDDNLELLIRNKQFDLIDTPNSATVKRLKSDTSFVHVLFENEDKAVLDYIKDNVLYCLANYEATSNFGCCSRFVECSDAKKCVHENKIYSMGCKYRKNLEAGRIFYGKNRNID